MKHPRRCLATICCFCMLLSFASVEFVQAGTTPSQEASVEEETIALFPAVIPDSLHGAALFAERYGRIYSAPSERSLCLAELFTKERFLVYDTDEEWTCILYHGLPAYISTKLLTFQEDLSSPFSHTGILSIDSTTNNPILLYPYLPNKWTEPNYSLSVAPENHITLLGIFDTWAEVAIDGNIGYIPTKDLPFIAENYAIGSTTADPNIPLSEASQKMWNFFKEKGLSDEAAAALIGNIYSESALNTMNLENAYETLSGYSDASYTNAVNDGSYSREQFIYDQAGYGLCQWTSAYRKTELYDMAGSRGVSIHDIGIQMDIIWEELNSEHSYLLSYLQYPLSLRQASDIVLSHYMVPAIQNDYIRNLRLSYCLPFYEAYR